jgi:hypothetical protein
MHFSIADHVEMEDMHPDAKSWATAMATLHRRSMGKSPNGQFGFDRKGYLANICVDLSWQPTWETLWTQLHLSVCDVEEANCGVNEDLSSLRKAVVDVVIPRYIRPLESDGRSIQASLLHNDAWPGNVKPMTDAPNMLCLHNSAAFWGHHERMHFNPFLHGLPILHALADNQMACSGLELYQPRHMESGKSRRIVPRDGGHIRAPRRLPGASGGLRAQRPDIEIGNVQQGAKTSRPVILPFFIMASDKGLVV